jgi:thymidylate synthase
MSTSFVASALPFSALTVVGEDIGEAWDKLILQILANGKHVVAHDKRTKELLGVSFLVKDLARNILINDIRKPNYRFMVAEWLWILSGRNDVDFLADFVPRIRNYSDDGKTLYGAYGPRLITQWDYIAKIFERDKYTRQAVAGIWTPNPPESADIPCTLNLQWLLREGQLHSIVNMRSSDAWLGLPYDFFTFSMLAMDLAADLGASSGSLQMNLGSSHLYEEDYLKAEAVTMSSQRSESLRVPPINDITVSNFARILSPEVNPLETLKTICREYR